MHLRVGTAGRVGRLRRPSTLSMLCPPAGEVHSPRASITATGEGDVVWRHTDQDLSPGPRLLRLGPAKWEKIRDKRNLREYEKEDLKEAF